MARTIITHRVIQEEYPGSSGTKEFYHRRNDTIRDSSGHNTFLFSGQFGNDRVIGYQTTDKLVFNNVAGSTDYRDHVKVVGADTVISFGTDSVTLVGVSSLSGEGIVIS